MQIISATEAKQPFGAVIDKAQREPVMIRKQNRDVAVILSIEDYQRITRTNIQEFQQFRDKIGKGSDLPQTNQHYAKNYSNQVSSGKEHK